MYLIHVYMENIPSSPWSFKSIFYKRGFFHHNYVSTHCLPSYLHTQPITHSLVTLNPKLISCLIFPHNAEAAVACALILLAQQLCYLPILFSFHLSYVRFFVLFISLYLSLVRYFLVALLFWAIHCSLLCLFSFSPILLYLTPLCSVSFCPSSYPVPIGCPSP